MSRLASLVALLLFFATAARAQDPGGAAWIRPEEIPSRANALKEEIDAARSRLVTDDVLGPIDRGLAELAPRLADVAKRIDIGLATAALASEIEDLRRELTGVASPLAAWRERLDAEAARGAARLALLDAAAEQWSETLLRPETLEASGALDRLSRASLDLARNARGVERERRETVIALDERLAVQEAVVQERLDRIAQAEREERRSLLIPEAPPLWRMGFGDALRQELPRVPAALRGFNDQNRAYLARDSRPFVVQALFGAFVALVCFQAGRRVRRRTGDDPELAAATRVLERPISIGVLLALLSTAWIHPLAPLVFIQLEMVIALIPVARIVTVASERTARGLLGGLFAILVIQRLGLALQDLPAVSRTVSLVALALSVALSVQVARRGGLPGDPRLVRGAGRVLAVAFSLAFLAEVGGWLRLAALIGRAAFVGALVAVYTWAAVVALDALVAWATSSPRFGVQPADRQASRRRAQRMVHWLAALLWVYLALGAADMRDDVRAAFRAVLGAGVSVGALSLTIGGVLAFGLTIALAPIMARLVNVVLERGVFPRAQLARGLPYALSTLVRYAVYALAFLAALAAAGVQLGQLSILLGGLGVGVGLGLQDVVKNFAAGLTLLFERRVHVGDVVQIAGPGIFGRVLEIGIRASLVRNWDGAEVVVPNAELVASSVTNWTLSDEQRRIELPVGVAYGTDPERVIELLLEVARAQADVMQKPSPQVLFQGFGESSLDFLLRVWSDTEYERTLAIRSELALATHRALRAAGIAIPFPQRDLHLASVSPSALALFDAGKGD